MADSILLTHSDLKSLVQKAIDNRATVELLDPKQAYFQLKSAYDYIQSELKAEESFAACPVVIRGRVSCYSIIGQVHVPATLIVDVVMHLGLIEDEGLSPKEVINENLNWLYGFADIEQIEDDIYIKFNDEFNELKKSHDSMFKSFSGLENIFKDFGIKYSSIRLGDIEKNQGDIVIINLSNKELLESALDKYFEDVRLNIWINDKNTCKYRIETNGIYTNIYYNPLYISSWINTSIDKYADRKKLLLSYGYSI